LVAFRFWSRALSGYASPKGATVSPLLERGEFTALQFGRTGLFPIMSPIGLAHSTCHHVQVASVAKCHVTFHSVLPNRSQGGPLQA
jgi:hypothetical protein